MHRWIVIVVSSVAWLPAHAADQSGDRPKAGPAKAGTTNAGLQTRPAQPPPLPPAPVEYLRQLLKMKPDERQKELVNRPKFLESKLREFETLPPDERENRLRTLELQSYLRPLMRASPTNRSLHAIPERDRPLVEARLKLWDQLPADEKRDMLETELAFRVLSRPEKGVITYTGISMIATQQQERINPSVDFMNRLPEEKREQMYRNFSRFFELSEHEKTRALDSFSEAERKRMEHTLEAFEKLPPRERDRCIAGFEKFRALESAEQTEFLRSAERWRAMTPQDRRIWRSLVTRNALPPPPLPPGFTNPAANLPPTGMLATNRY